MVHQIKALKEFKKPTRRAIKEINSDLKIGCNGCRHALLLSHGVYCALRRERIDVVACEDCPHFDPEPLQYRPLRRNVTQKVETRWSVLIAEAKSTRRSRRK